VEEEKVEENYSSDSSASIDFKYEVDEIDGNCIDPDTSRKQKEIIGPQYLRQVTQSR
jgi:hypothetical protein